MKILKGIIEEEKERLVELINHYFEKLNSLPKGSILIRKISGKKYIYLNFRLDGKPVSKYAFKYDKDKLKSLKDNLKERKRLEELLKKAKSNLKSIDKLKI